MNIITVADLKKLIEGNTRPFIIDVREEYEIKETPFEATKVTHIPLGELSTKVQNLPDVPLYFLCRAGARSAMACQLAEVAGHEKVYNIQGGMIAWHQLMESNK